MQVLVVSHSTKVFIGYFCDFSIHRFQIIYSKGINMFVLIVEDTLPVAKVLLELFIILRFNVSNHLQSEQSVSFVQLLLTVLIEEVNVVERPVKHKEGEWVLSQVVHHLSNDQVPETHVELVLLLQYKHEASILLESTIKVGEAM